MSENVSLHHAPSARLISACALWGGLATIIAVLWSLAGAGIYGSPLSGYDLKESGFIVAYLLIAAGGSLAAAVIAWAKPQRAATLLVACSAASFVILGRYFLLHPACILLGLVGSGAMALLANRLQRPSGLDSESSQPSPLRFTITHTLATTGVVALAFGHGNAARPRPFEPSLLMQELAGRYHPDNVDRIRNFQTTRSDAYSLLTDHQFRLRRSGSSSALGSEQVELHVSYYGGPAFAPPEPFDKALETALRDVLGRRDLTVVGRSSRPKVSTGKGGRERGFELRYRSRKSDGRIVAIADEGGRAATLYIQERPHRTWLTYGARLDNDMFIGG